MVSNMYIKNQNLNKFIIKEKKSISIYCINFVNIGLNL